MARVLPRRLAPVLPTTYSSSVLNWRKASPSMGKHSESPPHACAHWEVFAPAASRRTWIHVSESISGLPLSRPVPDLQSDAQPNLEQHSFIGLRVRHTLNSLIGRSLILGSARTIPGTLPYLVLAPISRDYTRPEGKLTTCY